MSDQPQDPVRAILDPVDLPKPVKAQLWDAFTQAADASDLQARMDRLTAPKAIKAELWDLKRSQAVSAGDAGMTGAVVTDTHTGQTAFVEGDESPEPRETASPLGVHAEIGTGVLKGAANTALGLGELFAKSGVIPGVRAESAPAIAALRQEIQPQGTPEQVGFSAEQMAEFFVPGGAAEKAAAWITSKLAPHLAQAPAAVRTLLTLLPRMATESLTTAGVTAAQGGDAKTAAVIGAAGPAVASAVGKGTAAVTGAARRVLTGHPTALEREAVAFGLQAGIPVDAATAGGSNIVKTAQKVASDSMGGASTAERFRAAQTDAFQRVGSDLAAKANAGGPAMDALRAGERVRAAITQRIESFSGAADTAYTRLRELEEKALRRIQATGGVRGPATSARPFTAVPLAVDLGPTKAAMKPIYDDLKREAELVPLMGDRGRSLTALDRLMRAPDHAPLSVADAALGEIKAVARVSDTWRRTAGQGVAAETVKHLEASVTAAARQGGPDVLRALMQGRSATIAKHEAIEVLDMLSGEPARVYGALTAGKNMSIEMLRQVRKMAPGEIKHVGRAYLEGLMDTATAEGGFGHADKLWLEWQKLGDDTKRILFPNVQHVRDLDNFFLLAKKAAENPNPSGTARAMKGLNLSSAPAMWALARVLYSPTQARSLMGIAASGNAELFTQYVGRAVAGATSQATR